MGDNFVHPGSLLRSDRLALLAGEDKRDRARDDVWQLQDLPVADPRHQLVRMIFDERVAYQQHAFRLAKVEISTAPAVRLREFERLRKLSPMYFAFHGSTTENHASIMKDGFLEEKFGGATDAGYVGKGVYLSTDPEYSMAFIASPGVKKLHYKNPVPTCGTEIKLIGVMVVPGKMEHITCLSHGEDLPDGVDSRFVWVNRGAQPVPSKTQRFATELVVKDPKRCYPRLVLTLVRVSKEVVWLDPSIGNPENVGYTRQFHASALPAHVYATGNEGWALSVLKRKKDGITRRAVTAGRGGEAFVQKLRTARVECEVMVFCGNTVYHSSWAKKYSSVKVTSSAAEFKAFVQWP